MAGGTVVAGSYGGTVFALDAATGSLKWSHDVNPGPSGEWEPTINGSAAIANGRVYVPVADVDTPRVVALSLADGSVLWDRVIDTQRDAVVFGSPVVWGRTVYIGVSALFGELNDPDVRVRGALVALDAATGNLRWKTFTVPRRHDGGAVWTTPAIDPETSRLYVGTGNAYHAPAADTTDAMLAVDVRSGRIVDHFQATPNDVWNGTTNVFTGPDHDFGASANLFTAPSGRKLVGEGQKSGVYQGVDRASMERSGSPPTQTRSLRSGVHRERRRIRQRHERLPDSAGRRDRAHAREAATRRPSWGGVAIDGGTVFTVTGVQGDSGFVVAYRPSS